MTPWADLTEHDRTMIGAAKRSEPVTTTTPSGTIVVATLIGWTPRSRHPVARVRFSTGTECTVPGSRVALIGGAA